MKHNNEKRRNRIIGTGIAMGAGGGVALGLVMMQVFSNPGFFALGIAMGASIGIAIAAAASQDEGG